MQIGIKETNINVITGTSLKSNDKRKTIFFLRTIKPTTVKVLRWSYRRKQN
jgi:hypothetical protein